MAILALACVLLGLGATWFLPIFAPITQQAFGIDVTRDLIAGNGFCSRRARSTPAASPPRRSVCCWSPWARAVAALVRLWAGNPQPRRVTGPAWDCGLPGLTAENEYTATAFSKPLRMIFAALFRPHREIQAEYEVSPYYPTAIHFESEIESTFEDAHLSSAEPRHPVGRVARCAGCRAAAFIFTSRTSS